MSLILNFYNLFLVSFLADSAVSVLDDIFNRGLSVEIFSGARAYLSVLVMLISVIAYAGMGLFASLPKRILFFPAIFPLMFFMVASSTYHANTHWIWLILPSFIQMIISLHAFYQISRLNNGQGCLLRLDSVKTEAFRWKNSLVFYGLNFVILLPLFFASLLITIAGSIQTATRGYVSFGMDGCYSAEKHFVKDNIELRLVGMAHIGSPEFYDGIKSDLQGKKALLLMEGITDSKDLLKNPPDMGFISKNLGMAMQVDKFSPNDFSDTVEILRADLDVSDFATGTVEVLNFLGKIYSKEGFSLSSMLTLHDKLSQYGATEESLARDVVTNRNNCLIGHVQGNLDNYNLIVIPWGALHLPGIEEWVVKNGFTCKEQKSRQLFAYSTLINKLLK